jgi:hypothetical protein
MQKLARNLAVSMLVLFGLTSTGRAQYPGASGPRGYFPEPRSGLGTSNPNIPRNPFDLGNQVPYRLTSKACRGLLSSRANRLRTRANRSSLTALAGLTAIGRLGSSLLWRWR